MLPESKEQYTYDEFLEITKDVERAEFIDGEILSQVTPILQHQNIIGNLLFEFKQYLKEEKCKPFISPFNIILQKKNEDIKRVQPDLFVLCDNHDMTKNEFNGVPALIIEVVSPSNASDDYIKKLNLYMKFEVKEYWIVSPKNKTIMIYSYDTKIKAYTEPMVYSKDDVVKSSIFKDLYIKLESIFQ